MNTPHLLCTLWLCMVSVACTDGADDTRPLADASMMSASDASIDLATGQDMGTLDMPSDGGGASEDDLSDMHGEDAASDRDTGPMLEPLPDLDLYEGCAPYVHAGPYTAGVTTLMIEGSPVEVFYPSSVKPGVEVARATYDLKAWLPEEARQKIPDSEPTTYEMSAYRDIALDGSTKRPIVLFSHGFAGYRLQSSFLLSHLASWGMVVASAEHPGRGLAAVLTSTLSSGRDVEVITAVLDEFERASAEESGSMFAGAVDMQRVAMTGHSAGGAAAIELGQTFPGTFATVIAYTPAVKPLQSTDFLDPLPGRKLFFSGSRDALTTSEDITSYAGMQDAVWRHLVIERAGHLAFTDICVIGREQGGILKIAEAHGVEVPLLVSVLATDGCGRRDLRAEIAWPLIGHFSVAELFDVFGLRGEGGAAQDYLGQEAAACFGDLSQSFEAQLTDP